MPCPGGTRNREPGLPIFSQEHRQLLEVITGYYSTGRETALPASGSWATLLQGAQAVPGPLAMAL